MDKRIGMFGILAFFLASLFLQVKSVHAATAPIAWWKFDAGTGASPVDSSGNNITGSFTSTNPAWSTDVPDVAFNNPYSLSFSSAGDGVTISWPTELNFAATDPRSFSFWYKPTANGEGQYSRIISWSNDRLEIAGTEAGATTHKITYFDGNWHATNITLSIGTWYHVTFTYDGTTAKFYIGDELQDEHTLAGRALSGTLRIGNRVQQLDEGINGNIDDVRIYNYALTSTQVANLSSGSSDPDSAPDSTAPTIGITVPSSGATIGGSAVTLTATSTDTVGVSGVTFYYDTTNRIGSEITATSSPNTYTATFDASGLSSGAHTLIAVARDAAGNRATSTAVSVTVDNTSPVISAVATSSITSSGATATWTTDEAASTKVVYSVNTSYGSSTSETDTGTRVTSHSKALSSLLSCTTYNFKTVSADTYGNYATSSAYSFTTSGCAGGATPSSATTSIVTVSSAATTTSSDSGRTIRVETPANFTATSSSVVIQIKGLDSSTVISSIGKPSSSLSSAASIAFSVTALIDNITELDSFATPVTVSYTYTDNDVSGLTESSLSMYHYANGSWSELDDCSVDTAANIITCEAPHFSVFAIFGTSPSSSSSSSSSTSSGAVIYKGGAASLPGYVAPQLKVLRPDGTYALVNNSVSASNQKALRCPVPVLTRTLRLGMKGEDVRNLQKLMNCLGYTLGTTGPGAPGNETSIFADRTLDAVKRFQKVHKDTILAPLNLTEPTGIFAELSRRQAAILSEN